VIHTAVAFVGALLILISLPGSLELVLLTCGGILPARRNSRPCGAPGAPIYSVAVVIPAHNESSNVTSSLLSLTRCLRPQALTRLDIVVIADNCTDDTAEVARSVGARVIERMDETGRGKGYALQYGFDRLLKEGVLTSSS
jgi:cellulose synthase/poly-beta-1,6-N-acetylglucosamine synthase-like glycosyltransferase